MSCFLLRLMVLCWFAVSLVPGQTMSRTTPEQSARAIINRVIRETAFEFTTAPLKPALDIQVVDFGSVFGQATGSEVFALSSIRSDRDTTIAFGLSRDLPLVLKLDGKTVYSASNQVPFLFHEIGYELFQFNDTLQLSLKKGNNPVLLKAVLSGRRDVAYLRELTKPGARPVSVFDFSIFDPTSAGKAWAFLGAFKKTGDQPNSQSSAPESGYKRSYSIGGNEFTWCFPSQPTVKEFRIKPDATYRRESYAEWQYPNGTVMLSLLDFATVARDTSVSSFVNTYCTFTLDNFELFKNQYERLHAFRGANHKLIRHGMLDDTGAPALPFVELLLRTHDQRLQPLVADVATYVSKGQARLEDGTLCRYEKYPRTVWADDLFMSAPYLMRMGLVTGDRQYTDDAAGQVIRFNKYLLDKKTGLYRHGWYDIDKRQAPVAWGRANGWVIWATSEVLRFLPESHPLRSRIVNIYRNHLKALVSYQASSGLWHQVLDRPDSYEETSCTAMYLIGMARGLRSGILDSSFVVPMKKAWTGLQSRISSDGIVKDICRGTEMSDDVDFYFKRERFDNDPRGLGAVISACVEMMTFQEAEGRR